MLKLLRSLSESCFLMAKSTIPKRLISQTVSYTLDKIDIEIPSGNRLAVNEAGRYQDCNTEADV